MSMTVSFYNSVNIKFKTKEFANTEYQFYSLCPQHNFPLSQGPKMDAYLRFNTFCYTCPRCPEFYSLHFHAEHRSCHSSCEPLRVAYRAEPRPIHNTRDHNCRHHFYNNRIPIGPLGNVLIPHHAYSPHFATEKNFHDAGDLFWCATAPKPEHQQRPIAMEDMEAENFICFQILFGSDNK